MGVPIRPLVPIRVPIPYLEETLVEEQSNATEQGIKSIKRTLTLTLSQGERRLYNKYDTTSWYKKCNNALEVCVAEKSRILLINMYALISNYY